MTTAPEYEMLSPNIYFANERGWHISACVIQLAAERGWSPDDAVYRDALKVLAVSGREAFEDSCVANDVELLSWMEHGAQAFIDDHLTPEGCWCGYSEGFGDWGCWENEADDDED